MAWGKKQSGGGGASCLALILSVLALLLAWTAYRRTGGELQGIWRDLSGGFRDGYRETVEDGSAAVDRQTGLAQAQAELLRRRAEVAGERNLEQVQREVAEIRGNLERVYDDAGAETKARWRQLDAELERLEGQLKEGSSKALGTLDSALAKLRREEGEERDDRR